MCTEADLLKAEEKYKSAKAALQDPTLDLSLVQVYANAANEAWREYKAANNEYKNSSVMKKLTELYGC